MGAFLREWRIENMVSVQQYSFSIFHSSANSSITEMLPDSVHGRHNASGCIRWRLAARNDAAAESEQTRRASCALETRSGAFPARSAVRACCVRSCGFCGRNTVGCPAWSARSPAAGGCRLSQLRRRWIVGLTAPSFSVGLPFTENPRPFWHGAALLSACCKLDLALQRHRRRTVPSS